MKTIKKTCYTIALAILMSAILIAGLLIMPQNLFANRSDHNNFRIYSSKPVNIKLINKSIN